MALPIKVQAGIDDAPIASVEGVSAKVFRFAAAWGRNEYAGGTWHVLVPLAVIDRRSGRAKVRPVIDPTLALLGAGLIATVLLSRRRRQVNG